MKQNKSNQKMEMSGNPQPLFFSFFLWTLLLMSNVKLLRLNLRQILISIPIFYHLTSLFLDFRYIISSSNNVIGKLVLNDFPYPMTITIVQLLSISLYSGPLLSLWKIRPGLQSSFSKDYYWKLIVPLAFGKFLSSVFSHVSIWKVPVSFAHTGKTNWLIICF